MLIIQWAACHKVSLHNGDCKSAFLQGLPDVERPAAIYMRPPQDGISLEANPMWRLKRYVYRLSAPVYGQANAPRRWFLYVLQVLTGKHWEQHTLDPCCFLQRQSGQVVALLGFMWTILSHVVCLATSTCWMRLSSHLCGALTGRRMISIFVGRHIKRQDDGGYTLDQAHYVADILKTRIDKDPEERLMDHPELVTEFRSGIGSLQWLAGTTRGDLSSYVSMLQKKHNELKVADLIEVNKVLKYTKATATSHIRIYPMVPEESFFVAYGDSGWANAPNGKSQGGYVVVFTNKNAMTQVERASTSACASKHPRC